jgi:hypothetical protein
MLLPPPVQDSAEFARIEAESCDEVMVVRHCGRGKTVRIERAHQSLLNLDDFVRQAPYTTDRDHHICRRKFHVFGNN